MTVTYLEGFLGEAWDLAFFFFLDEKKLARPDEKLARKRLLKLLDLPKGETHVLIS